MYFLFTIEIEVSTVAQQHPNCVRVALVVGEVEGRESGVAGLVDEMIKL